MEATPKVHPNLWKPRSGLELMNNDLPSTNPEEEAMSCFSLICPTLETKVALGLDGEGVEPSYGAVDAKRDDSSCPDQITLINSLLFRVMCMIPSKLTHFRNGNGNGNRKVHEPCIREEGSFVCLSFWLQLEGVPSSRKTTLFSQPGRLLKLLSFIAAPCCLQNTSCPWFPLLQTKVVTGGTIKAQGGAALAGKSLAAATKAQFL
ncbi:hypothetical protein L3X38_020620 [Prunus dulcis]|uniref:Uncharacterized protein n=1 Tax=Prunus dulcis TaxID=3755 RepID=A0AAD4ZD89_PRUDU|nr:hypothetical protein L3X38_020620 [Prunus dulcis]